MTDVEIAECSAVVRVLSLADEGTVGVEIDGCFVHDNAATAMGFAADTVSITDCRILNNAGMAITVSFFVSLFELSQTRIAGARGRAIYAYAQVVELDHVQVTGTLNTTSVGVGVYLRNTVATLSKVVSSGNGGTGVQALNSELVITQSALVGNGVSWSANSAGLYLIGTDTTLIGVDISSNLRGVAGSVSSAPFTALNTNIGVNLVDDYSAVPTFVPGVDGNLSLDPVYLDLTPVDPLDWDLHLKPGSQLVDASSASTDPDGSPADIGAYGGAEADLYDLDGDGWPASWEPGTYDPASGMDCDDSDPDVFPGDGC